MSLHVLTRVAAATLLVGAVVGVATADLKGDYHIEIGVGGESYSGMAKTTGGAKGEFTGTMTITSPTNVSGELKGKTFGDSITYESKYVDKDRNCTGTITARGTVEKDGSKASGVADINDSCSGGINGTFRLWR